MPETKPKVLIIEDDAHVRELLALQLKAGGFECSQAGAAQSGIDAALKLDYDAVIMDIQLPDSSGFQVCATLRKRSKTVALVMMTARFLTAEEKAQGFELGADEYVTKPFDIAELLARLRQLLSRPRSGQ
ncbi:MAG: response regulator transcription factor [Elusimicrobia bacterium]|nr:response regulator transcription factor [Elusimicrobiota bacterium]